MYILDTDHLSILERGGTKAQHFLIGTKLTFVGFVIVAVSLRSVGLCFLTYAFYNQTYFL
jgi:hypothetical protein